MSIEIEQLDCLTFMFPFFLLFPTLALRGVIHGLVLR